MFKRPVFFVCKEYIQIRKRVATQQEICKEKEQTGHPVFINKKKAVSWDTLFHLLHWQRSRIKASFEKSVGKQALSELGGQIIN